MRIPADAWDDVGNALYDVPDTELAALAATLYDLVMASPVQRARTTEPAASPKSAAMAAI